MQKGTWFAIQSRKNHNYNCHQMLKEDKEGKDIWHKLPCLMAVTSYHMNEQEA
jgi:hypothetical protein